MTGIVDLKRNIISESGPSSKRKRKYSSTYSLSAGSSVNDVTSCLECAATYQEVMACVNGCASWSVEVMIFLPID